MSQTDEAVGSRSPPQGILVTSANGSWQVAGLLDLPEELLVEQLMLLPIQDVLQVCRINQQFARICERKDFWYRRIWADFPEHQLTYQVDDPQALYGLLYHDQREAWRRIRQELENVNRSGPNGYWILGAQQNPILGGRIYLQPHEASQYVIERYAGRQGAERFVLWPDLRVAGTIKKIVEALRRAGFRTVPVGELYRLTDGRLGTPPGRYPLTEQLIAENSLDPLDPNEQPVIMEVSRRMYFSLETPTRVLHQIELFFGDSP